jgi:hypothetical protein
MNNSSTLLCSDKKMVVSNGNLQVFIATTNSWLSVPDILLDNSAQSIKGEIYTATNSIIGAVGALATLGSYYQRLPSTAAVVAGVVVGSCLLLEFTLKEDKFKDKFPLAKRAPITSNHEYYSQLKLKYDETLFADTNNELSINTTGVLCPNMVIYHLHLHRLINHNLYHIML